MSQEYDNPKIVSFKDLVSWQNAHQLTIEIYRLTANFPQSEQFGLTNQIRRASVSIASNISEGFGRRSPSDRLRFYDIARSSLNEVQAQLHIAKDVGFLQQDAYDYLDKQSVHLHKILTGLINKTSSFVS